MQKYPNITESFACTRKVFVVMDKERRSGNSLINSLISSGTCSTPKLSK